MENLSHNDFYFIFLIVLCTLQAYYLYQFEYILDPIATKTFLSQSLHFTMNNFTFLSCFILHTLQFVKYQCSYCSVHLKPLYFLILKRFRYVKLNHSFESKLYNSNHIIISNFNYLYSSNNLTVKIILIQNIKNMLIKLVLRKEIHLYCGDLNLIHIIQHANKVFHKLPKQFELSYIDSQNDRITISTQQDLQNITSSTLKINITQSDQHFPRSYQHLSQESPSFTIANQQFLNYFQQNQQDSKCDYYTDFISPVVNQQIPQVNKYCLKNLQRYENTQQSNNQLKKQDIYSAENYVSDKRKLIKSNSCKELSQKNRQYQSQIQDLVQSQIQFMIPNIISKIQGLMSKRLIQISCVQYQHSGLDIDQLIRRELLTKAKKRPQIRDIVLIN